MFHPLERQAKPAYERPLNLPSASDTDRHEKEHVDGQADDRAILDVQPTHFIDSETDELEGNETEAAVSVDVGPENLGDRVEWGTKE